MDCDAAKMWNDLVSKKLKLPLTYLSIYLPNKRMMMMVCDKVTSRTNVVEPASVTRLGDLLEFWQLFKAFGNNKFAQISPHY